MKYLIVIILFLNFTYSQTFKGRVFDKKTNEPIYGATVYFDGTTRGIITNSKGFFEIEKPKGVNSSLVISYLGYHKININPGNYQNKFIKAFLEEKNEVLEEVVLKPDNWSREKKLFYFLKEFLGHDYKEKECTIDNTKDLIITFDKNKNQLYAYSKKPLVIQNKHLGYKVEYDLKKFNLNLIKKKHKVTNFNTHIVNQSYYEGTSLYIEYEYDKKYEKNRKKEYNGSILHLMRSIKAKSLRKNKFITFKGSFAIKPEKIMNVYNQDSITKVDFLIKKINILYKRNRQSSITLNSKDKTIYIDDYGNFYPISSILFGGYMGKRRMSTTLPLDYNLLSTNSLQ